MHIHKNLLVCICIICTSLTEYCCGMLCHLKNFGCSNLDEYVVFGERLNPESELVIESDNDDTQVDWSLKLSSSSNICKNA